MTGRHDDAMAAELARRRDRDQQARTRRPVDWDEVAAVDADNTAWLADLLDHHGRPRRSHVGDQAAAVAWLLAQHARRPAGLPTPLPGPAHRRRHRRRGRPGQLAYLTDRVLRADGLPQAYGTQFWTDPDTGQLEPQPIEDPDHLDECRSAAGLEPFADYQRTFTTPTTKA